MVLRIGHRGAAGHAPENTLGSIRKAIDLGVDLIEVDVQRTADGHLVLMHDKRVDRTTDGSGYVSDLMLSDLRGLDAGGEGVPTLAEALAVARGQAGLMIEVITPGIVKEVCEEIRSCEFDRPVLIASFLHEELLQVRAWLPSARTLALIEGVPVAMTSFALDAEASHVGVAVDSLTEPFVEALHSASLEVFVYTVNDPVDIEWVKGIGVDGIISDYPDRIPVSSPFEDEDLPPSRPQKSL